MALSSAVWAHTHTHTYIYTYILLIHFACIHIYIFAYIHNINTYISASKHTLFLNFLNFHISRTFTFLEIWKFCNSGNTDILEIWKSCMFVDTINHLSVCLYQSIFASICLSNPSYLSNLSIYLIYPDRQISIHAWDYTCVLVCTYVDIHAWVCIYVCMYHLGGSGILGV